MNVKPSVTLAVTGVAAAALLSFALILFTLEGKSRTGFRQTTERSVEGISLSVIDSDRKVEPARIAITGLVTAGAVGGLAALIVFILTSRFQRRLRSIQLERDEQQRLEMFRREFVSNVSHEIKTPLTGILGAIEALDDDLTNEERQSLLDVLHRQSKSLNALVQDVLSLEQLERAQFEPSKKCDFAPCALDTTVTNAVALATPKAKAAGIKLVIVRNDKTTMDGDAILLEHAVSNLIENAIKYSGSEEIEVSLVHEGGSATVSVHDFGIGIAPEHQGRIFERFYRVDKARSRALGGTGLGLSIVKHIAQLHGGTASLVSAPGEGSDFRLKFII